MENWICLKCYADERKSNVDEAEAEEDATFRVKQNVEIGVNCPRCDSKKCIPKDQIGDIEETAKEAAKIDYS